MYRTTIEEVGVHATGTSLLLMYVSSFSSSMTCISMNNATAAADSVRGPISPCGDVDCDSEPDLIILIVL